MRHRPRFTLHDRIPTERRLLRLDISPWHAAPAAYLPMDFSIQAREQGQHVEARGHPRRHVGQTLEPPPYGKAATTFAAYVKQAPQPSEQPGTADKIFDFGLNRVLGWLFPMPDAYDTARWVHGKINETSPTGENLAGTAQRTAVDPIALSTGRPRRSSGTGVAAPDTPRETPAEHAVRRHPFVDWMPNMQLYKEIFSPGQQAAKPAAMKA